MTATNITKGLYGMKVTGKEQRDQAVKQLAEKMPLITLLDELVKPEYKDAKFYTENGVEIAEVEFTGVVYSDGVAQWQIMTYTDNRDGFKRSSYVVYDDSQIYINHCPVRRVSYNSKVN